MSSINGIGTTLYGRRDIASDGSYIATKWFIFFLLPIFPISSHRVLRGETTSNGNPILPGAKIEYRMIDVSLNWKQIINTYLMSWGVIILIFLELQFFQTFYFGSIFLSALLIYWIFNLFRKGQKLSAILLISIAIILILYLVFEAFV